MMVIKSDYANILKKNKILYMPSCLVVEMMTKLYSQVSLINLTGNLHSVVPDLLILLRRLNLNLRCTAEAYKESRIRFFLGDWKEDKLRARKLFFNLMSRLGYLCELVGSVERKLLYRAIEEMGEEWASLDGIMESKCGERQSGGNCDTCRYFRSLSPRSWQQIMARILITLDDLADYKEPGTYLILLCYTRIRTQLMREIGEIERRNNTPTRLTADRILCVSDEDIPITCPKCMTMTENSRIGEYTKVVRDNRSLYPVERISLKRAAESIPRARVQGLPTAALAAMGNKR